MLAINQTRLKIKTASKIIGFHRVLKKWGKLLTIANNPEEVSLMPVPVPVFQHSDQWRSDKNEP